MKNSLTRFAAFVAIILVIPFLMKESYLINVMVFVGINTMLAVALNLLLGYAGQISLGHAAFFGLGATSPVCLPQRTA